MNPKDHFSTENERKSEESRRNEQRFDDYNRRREAIGLPSLPWVDFLARRHGLPPIIQRANRLAAQKPEHRDNILLFSR